MTDLVITQEMIVDHYRKQLEGVDSILAVAHDQGKQTTIDFWAPKRDLIKGRLDEAIAELEGQTDEK